MIRLPEACRRHLSAFAAGGSFVFAVACVSVWWWISASTVRTGIENWIGRQQADGVQVTHAGLRIRGWPFKVRAEAADPRIIGSGFDWNGASIAAEAPLWDFSVIDIALPGRQQLKLGGVSLSTAAGGGGRLVSAPNGRPILLDLSLTEVAAQTPSLPAMPAGRIDIAARQPASPPLSYRDAGLTLSVTVDSIRVPGSAPRNFTEDIQRAVVQLRVMGQPERIDRSGLEAWSNDGGVVELDKLGLDWGPLSIDINGTLALDGRLQPMAAITAVVKGATAAVDAFGDRLPPKETATIRSVVTAMSRPPEGGGEPVLQAPLTVQDRALFLGPFRLFRLPAVEW